MEHRNNEGEPSLTGSFGRTSSSLRRRSLRLSPFQTDDGIESENVAEAGDIGDRALHSNRTSLSGSKRFSIDHALESGIVFPIVDGNFLQSYGSRSCDSAAFSATSPVSALPEETISPLSTDAVLSTKETNHDQEKGLILPPVWECISCLIYLAFFGILGVLTRYLLQKLFGPSIAGVTNDHSPLYLDLPSNMVGSFLMGWFGVVFKGDISSVSDQLAIGLSTGYLGSLTTFSGWNQKMLDLSVDGQWVFTVVGLLLGLFLAAYSIRFGVRTARCFRSMLEKRNRSETGIKWRVNSWNRHLTTLTVLVLMLGLLFSISGTLLRKEFNGDSSGAQLWLACIVAAPGVWIRWFLARLNGRGLGKSGFLKWVPFGTLIANVSAACIMAALATLKKAVDSKTCDIISGGIQLGFLGCLSTVSTFMAEYYAMEESNKNWRADAYALLTIITSFALGTLIYSIPVWTESWMYEKVGQTVTVLALDHLQPTAFCSKFGKME